MLTYEYKYTELLSINNIFLAVLAFRANFFHKNKGRRNLTKRMPF